MVIINHALQAFTRRAGASSIAWPTFGVDGQQRTRREGSRTVPINGDGLPTRLFG